MKKKALLLLFLTILCVNTLLLASCSNSNGNDNNGGTGDYVMQIPMKPILCVAPIHIAHELGYFTEEGLKYETYNTGASDYDLMVSGKNDVIFALLPTMIQRVANGMDLRIVMGMHKGCINAVVLENSDIQTIEDLRGKVIGCPGLAADPTVMLQRTLKANGIDATPDSMDVEFAVYNDTDLEMALTQGLVDCIVSWDPFATAVAGRGGRIIWNQATDEFTKDEYCCVIALRPGFIEDHPEEATMFARAMQRACDYIRENPLEAAQLQYDTNNCSNNDVELNGRLLDNYEYIGEIKRAKESAVNITRDFIELGIIETKLSPESFVENIFYQLPGINEPNKI